MKTATPPNVILHGECMVFESEIPAGAQPLEVKGAYLIVADSETTGNHHVVEKKKGVDFYVLDGVRYMRNSEPTQIRCVHADRHDAITLDPGTYEFGTQQEWDPFAANLRNVQD